MSDKWTEIAKSNPSTLRDAKLDEYLQLAWVHTAGNYRYGDIYVALLAEKTSK